MKDLRAYHYLGSTELRDRSLGWGNRTQIRSVSEVLQWCEQTSQVEDPSGLVRVTFIISTHHQLWIADRHSEHVACANGAPVLAAGEMGFLLQPETAEIVEISNQSTGYCPEPTCWETVENVLTKINIRHPESWTLACDFRCCKNCGQLNLIKESWFVCGVCEAALPDDWNCGTSFPE